MKIYQYAWQFFITLKKNIISLSESIKGIREFVEKSLTEKIISFNTTFGFFAQNLAILRLYYFYHVKYTQDIKDPFNLNLDIIRNKNEYLSIAYQIEQSIENRCSVPFVFRDSEEEMVVSVLKGDQISQDKEII